MPETGGSIAPRRKVTVGISVYREQYRALVKVRWLGGALTEFDVSLPRSCPATVRSDEDMIGLVRRLAQHHDDATSTGTARGLRVTQNLVGSLRCHWNIPRYAASAEPVAGKLLSVRPGRPRTRARRLDHPPLAQ